MYGAVNTNPMIAYFGVGVPPQDVATWSVEKVGSNYAIKAGSNSNYAIQVKSSRLNVVPFNSTDTTQLWVLA